MRWEDFGVPLFADRRAAGTQLGDHARELAWPDPVVLGLAGGAVAVLVAEAIDAPLEVAVARKVGAPAQPEFGVGAVTADGPVLYDWDTPRQAGADPGRPAS